MTFSISDACHSLGLRASVVVLRDVRVESTSVPLRSEIAQEIAAIRGRFADPQQIRALPEIVAFQDILRKVGINPRREQPSVERLLTYALKRGDLPAINSLVDAYNLVSIRSLCSLGAHDLDCITLPVSLRMLTGNETFTPLGGDKQQPVSPSEFGYVDAAGRVLCRLDILQADFSKVTTATRNALLIVEGTTAHAAEVMQQALGEAVATIRRYCSESSE